MIDIRKGMLYKHSRPSSDFIDDHINTDHYTKLTNHIFKKGQAFVLNMYLLTCYYYNDVYWVVPTSLLSNAIAIMCSLIYFSQ